MGEFLPGQNDVLCSKASPTRSLQSTTAVVARRFLEIVKKANGCRDTWEQPLKSSEIRELAVWLDQYRLADRYVLRGCRKQGQRIVINPAVTAELLAGRRGQN
jgi:hypothetical protein